MIVCGLLTACSDLPIMADPEALVGAAANAFHERKFETSERLLAQARTALAKPQADCQSALKAQSLATSITGFSEAIQYEASPTSTEKGIALLSAKSGIGQVIDRPSGCNFEPVASSKVGMQVQSDVAAAANMACNQLAQSGPNPDLLSDAILGKFAISCRTSTNSNSAIRVNYEPARDKVRGRSEEGLLYCAQFNSGALWVQAEYQRDVGRFGVPVELEFGSQGFDAAWPDGYRFSLRGNPNHIRRTLSRTPYVEGVAARGNVRSVLASQARKGDVAAATDAIEERYCLSQPELSKVIGMRARGSSEQAEDLNACTDLPEGACVAMTKMARLRGVSVMSLRSPNAGYGYSHEGQAELRALGVSPSEARAAETVICMQTGDC